MICTLRQVENDRQQLERGNGCRSRIHNLENVVPILRTHLGRRLQACQLRVDVVPLSNQPAKNPATLAIDHGSVQRNLQTEYRRPLLEEVAFYAAELRALRNPTICADGRVGTHTNRSIC